MREGLPPGQHQMHPCMSDPVHRHDRAGEFTFQCPGKLHLLVKVGHRQVSAAVKDLVPGGSLAGQLVGRQQTSGGRQIAVGNEQMPALQPVGDFVSGQVGGNLLCRL